MATRGHQTLDLIWVHISLTGLDRSAVESLVRDEYDKDARLSGVKTSINIKSDGTEALIKVPAKSAWLDRLAAADRIRVIRVFTERDHDEAIALVWAKDWYPTERRR